MLPTLGLFLPASHFCLYSPDDVVVWNDSSIIHICPQAVVKGSFSEHCAWYLVWTLLLGEMLDIASNGLHGGKVRLLCQDC
jgi:hypothetical protein